MKDHRQSKVTSRNRKLTFSRRQTLVGAATVAASLSAPYVLTSGRVRAQGSVLRIGSVGPQTGPASRTGENLQKGVTLAIEDARAAGEIPIVLDGVSRDVEIVWVDSQSSPEKAVKAFTYAMNAEECEFFMNGWHSSVAMALMDAEAPFNVVHLGHQGESQYINEKINQDPEKYKGWFKGWPSPPKFAGLYGIPLRSFMEQGKWEPANMKAGVIVEDTDYGRGWGEALTSSLKDIGFDVLPYDVTPLEETEFAPIILKYKAQGVSVVGQTITGSIGASNFIKQFRDQRLPALLIGHGLTWFPEWGDLTGEASDYVVTMDAPAPIVDFQKEWIEHFRERWNEDPSIGAGGIAYDLARMGITALNEAGTLDKGPLSDHIRQMRYKGIWNLYDYASEPGPGALSMNDLIVDDFMEGFFMPMVQLFGGERKIIYPPQFADQEFQIPPWI
jgi:branched-chain amino acid transport system substrate-binding protein